MIIDTVYIIIALSLALWFPSLYLRNNEKRYLSQLQWLIGYHFFFGLVFYFFTRNGGGDAWGYWTIAREMSYEDFKFFLFQGEGTSFMQAFNYFFANILNMGFLANTLFYTMLGSFGLVFFFLIAIRSIPYNFKFRGISLFPVVFYLPNLHFWSAGLGKDTLLFLCVAMFAYALQSPMKRIVLLVISITLSYLIRPHITLFMFLAFGLSYLISRKIPVFRRVVFSILLVGASVVILPQVLDFIKVDTFTAEALSDRAETQAGYLSARSGSGVDISSYPFPLQVLTFLFRPLFFDANNFRALLSSFDNLLLLLLSILAFRYKLWSTFKTAPFVVKAFLLFGIVGTIAFAPTLGNLGIMIRQKNMFTPGILIYMLWSFSRQTEAMYAKVLNAAREEDGKLPDAG